jgi:hypothetical protein
MTVCHQTCSNLSPHCKAAYACGLGLMSLAEAAASVWPLGASVAGAVAGADAYVEINRSVECRNEACHLCTDRPLKARASQIYATCCILIRRHSLTLIIF